VHAASAAATRTEYTSNPEQREILIEKLIDAFLCGKHFVDEMLDPSTYEKYMQSYYSAQLNNYLVDKWEPIHDMLSTGTCGQCH
jgi:hypothetical protein